MKKYVFFMLIIIYILTSNFIKIKNHEQNNLNPIIVSLELEGQIEKIDLENYVVGVVACEMPASFHFEALKAMAVAARTFVMSKENYQTTINDQCYFTTKQMNNKWNDNYEKYFNKIKEAVNVTKGKYLSYQGKAIKSFYFSTSNGFTENVEDVFSEELNYLKSVFSPWDKTAKTYYKEEIIKLTDFLNLLNIENFYYIGEIIKNDTGRVKSLIINDKIYEGTELRKLLNLRSTDFEISYDTENVYIKTNGYGHGVGMSQYGANGMANEGYNYEEILKYYYKDVELLNV